MDSRHSPPSEGSFTGLPGRVGRAASVLKPQAQPIPVTYGARPLDSTVVDCAQAACSCEPRAGARGGARARNPGRVPIFLITGWPKMAAMSSSSLRICRP